MTWLRYLLAGQGRIFLAETFVLGRDLIFYIGLERRRKVLFDLLRDVGLIFRTRCAVDHVTKLFPVVIRSTSVGNPISTVEWEVVAKLSNVCQMD